MRESSIVKNNNFEEIAEVRVDSKNRIALGKRGSVRTNIYKVYRNALGEFILVPLVTISAHEQWLFKNPEAAKSVQAGLEDARKRRLVKPREDYSKYIDED